MTMLQRAPKTKDKFAQVPIWWAKQAAAATLREMLHVLK